MDPVTHLTSGALAARALSGRFPRGLVWALCLIAAWIPDIDNFVGLGPEQYMLYHRGITHSLVGIAFQAMLLTGLFRLFDRGFTPLKTFVTAFALLGVHVWLDLVTTYGTQLLAPFDTTRFEWGSVFIIDPVLTLTALVVLVVSLFKRKHARRLAALGLAFMLLYPVAGMSVRKTVASSLPPLMQRSGLGGTEFEVTTDLLSPFFWKVVADDGTRYHVGCVSLMPSLHDSIEFQSFPKADLKHLERLGRQASFFATWDWFAKYPSAEAVPVPDGSNGTRAMQYEDLRFFSNSPLVRRFAGNRRMPFTLLAIEDQNGDLVEYRYNDHDKVLVYLVTN